MLLVEESITRRLACFHGKRPFYHVIQRDLDRIIDERTLASPKDFLAMLPPGLPCTFTNNDVAAKLDIKGGKPRRKKIASCMTYCFCQLGLALRVGKQGNAHIFSIVEHLPGSSSIPRGTMEGHVSKIAMVMKQ